MTWMYRTQIVAKDKFLQSHKTSAWHDHKNIQWKKNNSHRRNKLPRAGLRPDRNRHPHGRTVHRNRLRPSIARPADLLQPNRRRTRRGDETRHCHLQSAGGADPGVDSEKTGSYHYTRNLKEGTPKVSGGLKSVFEGAFTRHKISSRQILKQLRQLKSHSYLGQCKIISALFAIN